MLPPAADRPPPSHARRSEGLLAVAGATDGMSDRDVYASMPLPPYQAASRPQQPSPPPASPAPERLLRLVEAARTASSLGWDVVSLAAPEERDVLLGDDLRAVAAALRDALAAAAGGGVNLPERVLADAFAAFEELQYVMTELERPPPAEMTMTQAERQQQAMTPQQQREPAAMTPVAMPPPARLPPPPPPGSARQPAAADTEKPLIEL